MHIDLPEPTAEACEASEALVRIIAAEIAQAAAVSPADGGWMSFARYMELALYQPGLGYYSGGSRKFGEGGDFLTAPELTPLYGQALARQVAPILAASAPLVIEAGAGSGRLAADLLLALDRMGAAPAQYQILELSGELRARQAATLAEYAPALADRVNWLDALPEQFSGCLIGNEVLDAMPTHRLRWGTEGILEGGVTIVAARLSPAERPAGEALARAAGELAVSAPCRGEISLAARAWVTELASRLQVGAMILIDYGLPRHELYHPQRDGGTVRCHYRHRVHNDPFWYPGLSDITSHVDFTAVAEAAFAAGLDVLGYTNQANFLMNCGLGELLLARKEDGAAAAGRAQGAVNILISPNEMGELFKVIALGRGIKGPLLGFACGNRVQAL